jgi:2-iminobutanoate/2-iminopropanoate deaminase
MVKTTIEGPGTLPYSSGIVHDHQFSMEIAGQIGLDPETGTLAKGLELQTKQAMKNIGMVLENVGWGFEHLIKVRIYLSDMKDYQRMNDIYGTFFHGNYPTRVALAVKEMPLGALIEIDCTAAGDSIEK